MLRQAFILLSVFAALGFAIVAPANAETVHRTTTVHTTVHVNRTVHATENKRPCSY